MTSEFCFPNITLIDPTESFNPCDGDSFDFSLFTHIDLTAYGGEVVPVSNNDDIVAAFSALGIVVTIEDCLIYISTGDTHGDVPVCGYFTVNLIDPNGELILCQSDEINYNAFDSIDLSGFGGGIVNVNQNSDITDNLFTLGFDAEIQGCDIIITTCNTYDDIPVVVNPTITIVDTDEGIITCDSTFDYDAFDAVDLSFYGGPSEVTINSDVDLINAFATLGIEIEINGCTIHLIGYEDEVQDIEACLFTRINIVDEISGDPLCIGDAIDFTQFNQVNFIPYGGTITEVNNSNDIINILHSLVGFTVSIDGCDIVIHSCEVISIDLVGTSGDCANIEVEQEFVIQLEEFNITLSAYIDPLVGPNLPLLDGEILRVEIRDASDVLISFANTVVGQNWSTPAGIMGTSLNWLGATGFSTFTYSPVGNEGGGVLLAPLTLAGGLSFYFQKRDWAVANSYGGVGLGQDYTISFSLPNLDMCDDSFELVVPKVTEGKAYTLDLLLFQDDQEPGGTCCTSTLLHPDIPVGVFDDRFFDESTLQVYNYLAGTWINAVVQDSDGEDCAAGMQISFPDPNDPNLRHVCLNPYVNYFDPTGIRITTKNDPSILADIETIPLVCVMKGCAELPIIRTRTTLQSFISTNSNPFPKQVVVREEFSHFHDTTVHPLSVNCPINMIRADVYVANLPGLNQNPNNGQVYHSSVPVNPLFPAPPGTNQNTFFNATQLHSFPTEGVYVFKAEFERGPDCATFSGDWNDPGCESCLGPNQDDDNLDGVITNPEENTAFRTGFYVITSY